MMNDGDVTIPLDVPKGERDRFRENLLAVTEGTGRLMLFAGDQKLEHLNNDFFAEGVAADDNEPEHLFRIASSGKIGVFATQHGMIARYAMDYKNVPYLVKLNSRTNLVKVEQAEPLSRELTTVEQAVELRDEHDLSIRGVGYTVYLGSEHEAIMLREAAQVVRQAHRHGLLTVLWMYPRGKAVHDEKDVHLIAGAAGAACALGADFSKVNYPGGDDPMNGLREAVMAAGRTKVICSGGSRIDVEQFLRRLHGEIHVAGAAGNATGRNIHQKPLDQAVRMCDAIHAITVEDASVEDALLIFQGG